MINGYQARKFEDLWDSYVKKAWIFQENRDIPGSRLN